MFRSVADTPRNRLRLRRPAVTISEHKNTAIWTTIICLCSFMDYIILSDSSNRVWSRKKLRSGRHSHNIPAEHDAIASAKTKIAWPTFPASLCLLHSIILFRVDECEEQKQKKKRHKCVAKWSNWLFADDLFFASAHCMWVRYSWSFRQHMRLVGIITEAN